MPTAKQRLSLQKERPNECLPAQQETTAATQKEASRTRGHHTKGASRND